MKKKKIFEVSFKVIDNGDEYGNFYTTNMLAQEIKKGSVTVRRIKDNQLVGVKIKNFKVMEVK